ncbi:MULTISPECIES: glutamate-1-semialdehyde 2,1-aminomutase [unclassified Algoriphagus]|jgi:glutamate-1-semialdehyde 2,1-aminomutase|uniref:glutamate-1-semialdehyde 2,1-aminomutase n=2 Tax=Algoriphagus TaxID=246875 RepID=UPI000C62863B|nr:MULTISPECIES: glutamate-1-semialdehyde 2,1-aminomutase [unclassified Algoriphagus]MAL15376.1 glutamate-1-semialdehyde-2,1-aminomutase [Algoriphagus sp.]HAH37487.1 glutamate-1-semialdehyde-2,1-aminomutase [Algoriphagus sp.]HCH44584.1 glutamate-1-semialdehyde-2,1-aminomutase [Algoriphagus sp.]HCX75384.1 glutamate-1-semialdehyde-2,1-aminomutase [Algoriphagus sp.]|tara:strand:+ start:4562 stop:5854 length:1293 start_codon:yes stop_codon:yes gene_type:complete
MNISESKRLFAHAQNFIPGGVNSPVRAFRAVGGDPIFIKRADGAFIFDEDDNKYIELINSWGPMIIGHNHALIREAVIKAMENGTSFGAPTAREIEIAELIISMVPSVEKVRMVNSGTEATMSAIRLARGYTGRDKIVKMEGHYHGHGDSFLISAGSGAITMGNPDSPGVTKGTAKDTLLAPYNSLDAIEKLVAANKGEIAALILEPVPGNMGLATPMPGYLEGLREICTREGIVLIFDEVMTGFRLAPGGAQELFGVTPDMTTLGKIIGGGMPVGAYGGKKEIMEHVSPAGPVYQAGTLSGNPIAMAAGLAMLRHLNAHHGIYGALNEIGRKISEGIKKINIELGYSYTVNHLGSMYSLFFSDEPVIDFESAKKSNTALFGKYFQAMLKRGVYLAPSQFESLFLSTALTDDLIQKILDAHRESMLEIHS